MINPYLIKGGITLKSHKAGSIRNVALAGHGGKGKTTVAEAMLYLAGMTDRMGTVAEGTSVMDSDPLEKKRKSSVSTALASVEWKDTKINILDTPGQFDFECGQCEGVRAADCVIVVTSAGSDCDIGAQKVFSSAKKQGKGRMFAITKTDSDHRSFYKTFEALRKVYGTLLCPVVVPHMEGNITASYVDLIHKKAFTYQDGKATEAPMPDGDANYDEMLEIFREAIATTNDELLDKFFEGEAFTAEEIIESLKQGVAQGSLYPVFAVSGLTGAAVNLLLDGIEEFAPSAADKASELAADTEGNLLEIACDESEKLAALCFKTIADPFVGRMSFVKVIAGKLTPGITVTNARTGAAEKAGKIVGMLGGKQTDMAEIVAGDIGVLTKLDKVRTGDTLCDPSRVVKLEAAVFPRPCLSMAVFPAKKGEEEKVASGLMRLMEEDPTINFYTDNETHEQILSGLGEQHLDVITNKLKTKFGVDIILKQPKVAYRETIRKTVQAQGRHKKQSGGHGQFGDVFIRFEPCSSEDLVFDEEVFGGAVPKNFFPAVEKGLRESMAHGVLAGYPMVGVKAVLYDGSYHPVDSSEMAFKLAANLAFKNGIPNASPALLEPVGSLHATIPEDTMGDIMGDITKRRGRVLGMNPSAEDSTMQVIEAEVPMAEMADFSTMMRSVTRGRGSFELEFLRYDEAPQAVADKVIAEQKAE